MTQPEILLRRPVLPAILALLVLAEMIAWVPELGAQNSPPVLPTPPVPAQQEPIETTTPAAPIPGLPLPAPPLPLSSSEKVQLQFPNNPVEDVLDYYQRLTGLRVVRDSNLGGAANLSIEISEPVSKEDARKLIEAAFLLNGYVFLQMDKDTVKILNTAGGKNPRSEGVILYADPGALPEGEVVVSYFMPLNYITPEQAVAVFQSHVQLHVYGAIVPVPNAQAVVITENATLIRQLVGLRSLIDVPPAQITTEFVQLLRADAEKVAEMITELLEKRREAQGLQGTPGGGGGGGGNGGGTPPVPGQPAQQVPVPGRQGGSGAPSGLVGDAQVQADPRTNRILITTRPINVTYLRRLIQEFDKAVTLMDPYEHQLSYLKALDALPVLVNLLADTEEQKTDANVATDGSRSTGRQGGNQPIRSSQRDGGIGDGASQVGDLAEPEELPPPESVTIGSTTLIADNQANSILVIGPPESKEKARSILERLDRRPMQVYLSTVIGQLRLTNDWSSGVDILQKFVTNSAGTNGIASSLKATPSLTNFRVDPTTLTSTAAFPVPLPSGLTAYGVIGDLLEVYANALESTGNFKVLARPTVFTTNNKLATILQGEKVAVPVSTLTDNTGNVGDNASIASNIQYQDVVLRLDVTPLININREVQLNIKQKNDRVTGVQVISGNTVPRISTQELKTTVTVPNRATVVLGGLITDSIDRNISGAPWVSRLPILGYLFRSTTNTKERQELIVMIQPTVVEAPTETLEASYNEQTKSRIGQKIRSTGGPSLIEEPPLPERDPD